jgi:hypothetical protein
VGIALHCSVHPGEKAIMETMRFNEELVKAGVLLDAGGLYPSSQGKRIRIGGRESADHGWSVHASRAGG